MKLSTGKVAFPIEFDNGDKQTIFFNPCDPELFMRISNFNQNMKEKIDCLEDVELTPQGDAVDSSQMELLQKMQMLLKEELDYVFGGAVSEVVFKHCSPFAIVEGEFFVVQFLNAITPEIEKSINKSKQDAENRIKKHIGKYTK